MSYFSPTRLAELYQPQNGSTKTQNGQLTIIGGSDLFHGAPLFALRTASRIVDMVFFTSPEPANENVAAHIKAHLSSFIWVPFAEVEHYIEKSNAILIGPGLKRYRSENQTPTEGATLDEEGHRTRQLTLNLLQKFPDKQWIIDAGSLQTISPEYIPANAILTPNLKEYQRLFGNPDSPDQIEQHVIRQAQHYNCIIVYKAPETMIVSPHEVIKVPGGNSGLSKGGTGDTLAGLTASLASRNPPLLAAAAASFILKAAADYLYHRVGPYYSADDLAEQVPRTLYRYLSQIT